MKVIESFSHGKIADNSYSEDRLVIAENVVGVVDASRGPGYTNTDLIQGVLKDVIALFQSFDHNSTPQQTTEDLTEIIRAAKHNIEPEQYRYAGGFCFAVYIPAHRQVWRVGDCAFRYDGATHFNTLEIEEIAARQRSVLVQAMLARGSSVDEVMASEAYARVFEPFLAPLLDFANHGSHKYGFGAVTGQQVPDKFIEVFDIPENTKELTIVSDGYPVVCDTLEDTETFLFNLLKQDPLCITENTAGKGLLPGQVSFDDRTYLRLSIAPKE